MSSSGSSPQTTGIRSGRGMSVSRTGDVGVTGTARTGVETLQRWETPDRVMPTGRRGRDRRQHQKHGVGEGLQRVAHQRNSIGGVGMLNPCFAICKTDGRRERCHAFSADPSLGWD